MLPGPADALQALGLKEEAGTRGPTSHPLSPQDQSPPGCGVTFDVLFPHSTQINSYQ